MRRFDLKERLIISVIAFHRALMQIGVDERYSTGLVILFKLLLAVAFVYGFFRTIELFG